MNDDALFFQPIRALAKLLRRRELSSLELTLATLKRLEALGPRYNAVAQLTADAAEAQARRADRLLRRGGASLLCGIPYGAKDLVATAGISTRWGAPPYRDQVFDFDATVIERLRETGAVLVAKLSMIELAGAGGYQFASASLDGPCRNPWNTNYWSGGSSSGSGAAVAAGLIPFALGSETGGSIVIPAAFCGISGLRPSYGLVSRFGVMPVSWSMDKIGTLARTAEDCGLVLAAISGPDKRDPVTVEPNRRLARRAGPDLRIGVLRNDLTGIGDTDGRTPGLMAVQHAFDEALGVFRRVGARLRRIELPQHDYREIYRALLFGEAGAAHEALISSARLGELVDEFQRQGLVTYLQQPAFTYVRAVERRVAATRDLRDVFDQVDVLVAPTWLSEAPSLETDLRTWHRGGHYAVLGAVAGLPGISIPIGFGPTGLPLGLTITGDLFADSRVLHVAALFQRNSDWHRRRPPNP